MRSLVFFLESEKLENVYKLKIRIQETKRKRERERERKKERGEEEKKGEEGEKKETGKYRQNLQEREMDYQWCRCLENKKIKEIGGGRTGLELGVGYVTLCTCGCQFILNPS